MREVTASLGSLASTHKGSGQRNEETPERGKMVHQAEALGYKLMGYINTSIKECISDHGELVSHGIILETPSLQLKCIGSCKVVTLFINQIDFFYQPHELEDYESQPGVILFP